MPPLLRSSCAIMPFTTCEMMRNASSYHNMWFVRWVQNKKSNQLLQTNNNPCVIPSAHLQESVQSVLYADKVLDSAGQGGVVGVSNYQSDFAQAGGWYPSNGCSLENDLEITSLWSESQTKIVTWSSKFVSDWFSLSWWDFIILNDCFQEKCVADSHASHTVQHAHPALRQFWDGGGRFKHLCHGSKKSSTNTK